MSTPVTPDEGARQLTQLLARYIGPLGKMLVTRGSKSAHDDTELVDTLAQNIDSESDRGAFVAAARRIVAAHPVIAATDAPAQTAEVAAAPAAAPRREAPPPAPAPARAAAPSAETEALKAGGIFLSYARDDLAVATRIAEALRAAGLEVWFDIGRLQAGDAWDLKIRRSIEACSYFVPLISQSTETRQEGYFRREWNIAADRALNFADDVPFILPVVVDGTQAYSARVPERFKRAHWIKMPDGQVTDELVDTLKKLVEDYFASR